MQAESPPLDIKQDLMYSFAYEIGKSEDYIYSLQEGYIYGYKDGYWQKLYDEQFLANITEKLPEITHYAISTRKQIIENFKYKRHILLEEFNKLPYLNFENAMFDLVGMNVMKHEKEYYSTLRIPYKYDMLAKCPLWERSLMEIFENNIEKINLLQEFLGYCISPDNEQKKGLLLLGDTDTGKSTILEAVRDLLGNDNIADLPLEHLRNPQYTPLLINKMIMLDPDVNKESMGYEREFKILTGGKEERISCNQKHIPTFSFTPRCKVILAANIFPKIADHSSAFYQRLLVIPCERKFLEHEKNRNLNDELKGELSGIFNWVVEGWKRLKKRGKFEQNNFMKAAIQDLEDENNPVNEFFNEHIEVEQSDEIYIEKTELYNKFKLWAKENNNYVLSADRFARCVYKKYHTYTPKDTSNPINKKRIWRNLRYVEQKGIEPIKEEIQWEDSPRKTSS